MSETPPPPRSRPWLWVLFGGLALGLILRIVVALSPAYSLDSDTSIVYLMAKHAAAGEWSFFFWGQSYGGSLIPTLAGLLVPVMGETYFVVVVVELLLGLLCAVLLYVIGANAINPAAGVTAALVFWLPGFFLLKLSTVGVGFYSSSVLLGMAAVAVATLDRPWSRPRIAWFSIGVLVGLAFWCSISGAVVGSVALIPALARRPHRRLLYWGLIGGVLGAVPWILGVVNGNAAKAVSAFSNPLQHIPTRLANLVTLMFPNAFVSPVAGLPAALLGTLLIGVVVAALVVTIRRRQWVAFAVVATVPLICATLLAAGSQLGFEERRYVAFLLPGLAMSVAALWGWLKAGALATVAAAVAATVVAVAIGTSGFSLDHSRATVYGTDIDRVVDLLEDRGQTTTWGSYWIAYRITASSNEHVVSGSVPFDRYAPYNDAAAQSARTIVVALGDANDELLQHSSEVMPIDRTVVGDLVVYEYPSVIDARELGLGVF